MNPVIALFILAQLHSPGQAQTERLYTMNDLAVLAREKNFDEFLSHVNDIRPSEREKVWKDMYQSMAVEMIDYKSKTKDFSLKSFKYIETLARTSTLQDNDFFQLKRDIYAKKFLNNCYTQVLKIESSKKADAIKICDNELDSFWTFSKKNPDIGIELAHLISQYQSNIKPWPFYALAISDSVAPIYCENVEIQRAVINKLTEDSFNPNFDNNYKNLIKRLVPEKCFAKIIAPLKLALQSPLTNGLEKEMALNLLSASGKLNSDEEDLYAILYLLDGPVVGDVMNLAWSKVEKLGEKYKKRQAILAEIKKLSHVPDKIFKDPAFPRHKAIINLFAKHFPEYVSYYGENCLHSFSDGLGVSRYTSTSFQCNQFFKAAKEVKKTDGTQWVSDSVERKYSGLKK